MDSLVESAGIITRFNFSEVGNTKQIKFDDFLGLMVFAIRDYGNTDRLIGYHITYTTETASVDIVISLEQSKVKEYFYIYMYENGWNKRLDINTSGGISSIRRFMDLSDESVFSLKKHLHAFARNLSQEEFMNLC